MASDNFERANGGPGANWANAYSTTIPQICDDGAGGHGITGTAAADFSTAYYAGASWSATHSAEITAVNGASYQAPAVRVQASGNQYYAYFNSGDVQFVSGGSGTVIGTRSTWTTGDAAKIAISGSTITVYKNGVQNGATITDSNLSGGAPGIAFYGNAAIADLFVATGEAVGGTGTPDAYYRQLRGS